MNFHSLYGKKYILLDLLEKPLYLDILREVNKLYQKKTGIFGYYGSRVVLENVRQVKESEYDYYEIEKSSDNKINYITFEYSSWINR